MSKKHNESREEQVSMWDASIEAGDAAVEEGLDNAVEETSERIRSKPSWTKLQP